MGCVVYELVYLEFVFGLVEGESLFEILNNIVNGVFFFRFVEVDFYSLDFVYLIVFCLMYDFCLRLFI